MNAAVTYFPKDNAFVAGDYTFKPDNWGKLEMISLEVEPGCTVNFDVQCGDPTLMRLAKTYCRMKLQQKQPYLDCMFDDQDLDRLESDGRDEILFELQKSADTYDLHVGSTSDALPINLSDVANAWLYRREQLALIALEQLEHHYQKNAKDDAMRFRLTAAPANDSIQRISNPANRSHDKCKALIEISECRVAFMNTFKRPLDRVACSLDTATELTRGTPTYDEIESAVGTNGMVCPLPCMEGTTMVIATACPRNVLYAASKYALLKYEGPKIISQNQSGIHTVRDLNLHKCAHEDPSGNETLGFIIDLHTA